MATTVKPSIALSAPDANPSASGSKPAVSVNTRINGDFHGDDTERQTTGGLRLAGGSGAKSTSSMSSMSDAMTGGTLSVDVERAHKTTKTTGGVLSGPDIRTGGGTYGTTGEFSPEYFFYGPGSMSEELLHKYMDKAMEANGLCVWGLGLPGFIPGYPVRTSADHDADVQMIIDTGAKFVKNMIGYWGWWVFLEVGLEQFRKDVEKIHNADPDVICAGMVFEYIDNGVLETRLAPFFPPVIPPYVYMAFDQPVPPTPRYFDDKKMLYDPGVVACGYIGHENSIDITKLESQMFVYYLATLYIENGAEAIDMGSVFNINCVDGLHGNKYLYKVANLIRQYAYAPPPGLYGARRKFVLVGAGASANPQPPGTGNSIYYDPTIRPGHIAVFENWRRQLIFDFQVSAIQSYIQTYKVPGTCSIDSQPVILDPMGLESETNVLGSTTGGIHPQGWYCAHSACFIDNDTDSPHAFAGCFYYDPPSSEREDYAPSKKFWGYDEASWLPAQSPDTRDLIIRYFYYGFKCTTPFMHYLMPGRLYSSKVVGDEIIPEHYRANEGGQDKTIKNVWDGEYDKPQDWVHHDFLKENVSNGLPDVGSSLIFVGDDKIFYINKDGYINGYIKVNGNYNGGTWLTVSPSAAAEMTYGTWDYSQLVSAQVKAKSDLVASPDGTRLLYIGVDGHLHGFNIVGPWTYYYTHFIAELMYPSRTQAVNSLIFLSDNMVCFIGNFRDSGGNYVCGLHIDWTREAISNVNPCQYAERLHGQRLDSQFQASGSLTYEPNTRRLYYRSSGHLAFYIANDFFNYYYVACPGNFLLIDQQIVIVGNLATHYDPATHFSWIYFVGMYIDGTKYIHCLVDDGTPIWRTVSPSYSADVVNKAIGLQAKSDSAGEIAVTPDGNTIAYIGKRGFYRQIYYFNKIDDWQYRYNETTENLMVVNSLQYTSDDDLFFITNFLVSHFKYQVAYCDNEIFNLYPVLKH